MRLLRSAIATATLLLIVAGVPWILLRTIGNPAAAWPDLVAGDVNDQVVYSVLAAVAWIAWAQFTVAFGIELISGLRRSPVPRPLFGVFAFQQLSARALITAALMLTPAVLTILAPTAVAVAAVANRTPATASTATAVSTPRPAAPPLASTPRAETVTISTSGPRTWWDLAQQHLGSGQKWSELWTLNQGRPQPAGIRMSTPGPLKPGWTVLIPATATTATPVPFAASTTATQPTQSPSPSPSKRATVVTVRPGDSLSLIAMAHGIDWSALWQVNQGRPQPGGAVLTDPDQLEVGWTILIPTPPLPAHGDVQVQPGDTLSGIAASQHVALQQVWAANENRLEPGGAHFTDPNYLEPGWIVRIPKDGPVVPPADSHRAQSMPKPQAKTPDQVAADARASAAKAATDQKATADRAAQQAATQRAAEQASAAQAEAKAQAAADAAATKEAGEQRDADARASTATSTAGAPTEAATPTTAAAPRATSSSKNRPTGSSLMPVLVTGGGGLILAGLVVGALKLARRRQFRWRRPGRSVPPTPPELLPMERALLGHGRQSTPDVAWLDHAMRSLAAALAADPAEDIPPVVAARLAADELEIVMAKPHLDAPDPWDVDDSGLRWTVARTANLPLTDDQRERTLAPFPAMACVGHTTSGEHWLLDLEMIGTLAIRGDHTRGLNLARYLAAELAHNTWSDSLQVTLIGFGQEMATANPDRLTFTDNPDDARQIVRVKTDAVREVSTQSRIDLDHGRLHNIAGDTWATHVLLIDTDHHSIEKTGAEPGFDLLGGPSRQALAIVLIDPDDDADADDHWTINIDDNGTLRIPALDLNLTAQQLPASEAAALTQLLALATRTDDEHPTHAEGNQPWDEYADTTGALATDPDPTTANTSSASLSDAADGREGSVLPLPTHTYVATAAITEPDINALAPKVGKQTRSKIEQTDPDLDEDLADWRNPNSRTPKVTVLGPVDVHAQGALDPQRPRRAWNVEVVTYLATRPHGATAERLGSDLWPDEPDAHEKSKLRNAISTARRWLGPNPKTGRDHLPVNPGTPGSVYRVEGVLVDAELFRRLRIRATARGADGIDDLDAALQLVSGPPFDSLRPGGYGWLADQALDHAYTAMIADVSHLVATHHLTAGNPDKAMTAAQVALLAGSYADEPLLDCAAACYAQGLSAEGASYVKRILTNHDAEVEEELPPRTYEVLRRRGWLAS